ncbi:MAG TPA: hypothetical protein VHR66_18500 [Gemmataceae bacterium]|jgi:hypothetical protein|nr:hypothetical protein [Gemmataceae bacterium]
MVRVNPDPHADGYEFFPTHAVTGFFSPGQETASVLSGLSKAGFDGERVDVFSGDEGAERLDPEGRHHGWWVRFRRTLEGKFADDADVFHRAEETLRTGGTVIEAFTHGDKNKRVRATEILKSSGAHDVIYWGRLINEYM